VLTTACVVIIHIQISSAEEQVFVNRLNIVGIIDTSSGRELIKEIRSAHCHTEPVLRSFIILKTDLGHVERLHGRV